MLMQRVITTRWNNDSRLTLIKWTQAHNTETGVYSSHVFLFAHFDTLVCEQGIGHAKKCNEKPKNKSEN
jgi:hypothetical protein